MNIDAGVRIALNNLKRDLELFNPDKHPDTGKPMRETDTAKISVKPPYGLKIDVNGEKKDIDLTKFCRELCEAADTVFSDKGLNVVLMATSRNYAELIETDEPDPTASNNPGNIRLELSFSRSGRQTFLRNFNAISQALQDDLKVVFGQTAARTTP